MAMFDYQIHLIQTPWITTSEIIIGARRGRKLLGFASVGGGFNWRFDPRASADINSMIIQTAAASNELFIMEYKTWGPLVESAWYGNDGGAGAPLQIIEVYQIQ